MSGGFGVGSGMQGLGPRRPRSGTRRRGWAQYRWKQENKRKMSLVSIIGNENEVS